MTRLLSSKRGLPLTGPSPGPPRGPSMPSDSFRHQDSFYRSESNTFVRGEQKLPQRYSRGDNDDNFRPRYGRRSISPRSDKYHSSHIDPYREKSRPSDSTSKETMNHHAGLPTQANYNNRSSFHDSKRNLNYDRRIRRKDKDKQSFKKKPHWTARGNCKPSKVASEREFLRTKRDPTPQLMSGMNIESENAVKFLPLEDLSDSEEADMDLSGSENDGSKSKNNKIISTSSNCITPLLEPNDTYSLTIQPNVQQNRIAGAVTASMKNRQDKANISQATIENELNSMPRWSNPDPYTALPPPDESQKKKKDVVKLIRKARIASENKKKSEVPTDDFISFNFEDSNSVKSPGILPRKNSQISHCSSASDDEPRIKLHQTQDSRSFQRKFRRSSPPPDTCASDRVYSDERYLNRISACNLTSESTLGIRKRTVRDELKAPPTGPGRDIRSPPDGRILRDWLPLDEFSQSPWLVDHSIETNMYNWLHEEILDFYHYVKPREFEQCIRENLVNDLRRRVRNFSREADIRSFGSFPAGLYLPTGDLDLVMVSDYFMQGGRPQFGYNARQVFKFARFLEQEKIALRNSQECVIKAKVPLVKYIDNLTGLKVDISFENTTGLAANQTFQVWKKMFPAMPILVTLIKQFLSMRGLNEPVNGGIGGFSVTCLVVSLLQHMPEVQDGSMIPEHHLGEVLLEFFDLYGNKFNTMKTAISLDPACYYSKRDINHICKRQADKFCIIDPNNPENDIAGGSKNSTTIKRAFQNAYGDLRRRMSELQKGRDTRRPQSILSCIIGGNYNSFMLQRERLANVYENKFGPLNRC